MDYYGLVGVQIQSQIIQTDGSFRDTERLERLLKVKVQSFVDPNLTVTWFPQSESVCCVKNCAMEGKPFISNILLDQYVEEVHGGVHQKKSSN